MHSCGVLHRDLKSSNIFLTRNDRTVKLGDFGLAATNLSRRRLGASPRRHSRCGTDMYMSPEVEQRRPYGAASDVYALGCVLLEMLVQQQLRPRRRGESRHDAIKSALDYARRAHGWVAMEALADLAWKMVDPNPKTRATLPATAVLCDEIVDSLPKQPPASQSKGGVDASTGAPSGASDACAHGIGGLAQASLRRRPLAQSPSFRAARQRRLRMRYAPD